MHAARRWVGLGALLAASGLGLAAGCGSDDDDGSGGASAASGTGGAHASGSGGAPLECAPGCQELGFEGGEEEGDACVCGGPTDPDCYLGMTAVCTCNASINQPCSDGQAFDLYVDCFEGDETQRPLLLCVATYVEDDTIDCEAARDGCTE